MEKLSRDEKKGLKLLEKELGVRFWKKNLLKRALTHRSYANEKRLDALFHNERLEFLGDAVLELVVSHILMEKFPEASEGELSKLRASIVNEKTLAEMSKRLGLGEKLYLGRGEEIGQGRSKNSLLSDAYEALLGALYLDRGFKKAFKIVCQHAEILLSKIQDEGFYQDYKTKLQERVQVLFKTVPRYRLVEQEGPDHAKLFTVQLLIQDEVYGLGRGKNKKDAEQSAARQALEVIEKGRGPVERTQSGGAL